jgi:hypothetical protein
MGFPCRGPSNSNSVKTVLRMSQAAMGTGVRAGRFAVLPKERGDEDRASAAIGLQRAYRV